MVSTYTYTDYDWTKAKSGALCIILKPSTDSTEPVGNASIYSDNSAFVGVGICKDDYNGRVSVSINGIKYVFNTNGTGYNKNAKDCYIRLVTNGSNNYGGFTRAGDNGTEVIEAEEESSDIIAYKRSIIASVLPALIAKIDKAPSEISDAEIMYYCCQAYKWAENMFAVYPAEIAEPEETSQPE